MLRHTDRFLPGFGCSPKRDAERIFDYSDFFCFPRLPVVE